MLLRKSAVLAAVFAVLTSQAQAADSPVGTWKNIDDETHQAKALIQISQGADGELSGHIVKLLQHPDALCEKCDGELKGKPVLGMTILWGLKQDGDAWKGGKIIDPKSGSVYRASLKLLDGGRKLDVHGYIGISLLGRSQVWERQ